jgi:methyl-accepting chemotaxis protein
MVLRTEVIRYNKVNTSAEELSKLAEKLKEIVSRFKIS